jgi:hypothetical protein
MAKRFLEAPQIPDYIVRKGPYVTSNKQEGIDVMMISAKQRAIMTHL